MSDNLHNFGPIDTPESAQFRPNIEYLNTSQFEHYRDEHLAAMNFRAGVLRFYNPLTSVTAMVRNTVLIVFLYANIVNYIVNF